MFIRTPLTNAWYWSIVLLVSNALAIVSIRPNFLSWVNSFGMSGADTEGTMWWIWSQCKFGDSGIGLSGQRYPLVAFPGGIDSSELPFSNFVDLTRILLGQVGGCSVETVLLTVNALPYVAFVSTLVASVFLMNQLTSHKAAALIIGLIGVTTPTILLATRTSLSNNVLAFGILSIAFCIRHEKFSRRKDLLAMLAFLILQISSNLYNGFWAVIVCLTITLVAAEIYNKDTLPTSNRFKIALIVLATSVITVCAMFWNQLFLLFDQGAASQVRPFDMAGELLPSRILLPPWVTAFSSESGWLPTLVLVMWLVAIVSIFFLREDKTLIRWLVTFQITALVTVFISHDFPFASVLHELYFKYFSLLRGVSNYDKYLALLIAASFAVAFEGFSCKFSRYQGLKKNRFFLSLVVMSIVLVYSLNEALPNSKSFRERTSLLPFEEVYSGVNLREDDVIAHYPDLLYQSWGFPHSEIQIHQMFHGKPVLNGKARETPYTKCFQLPVPSTENALMTLRQRGASILVLHVGLIAANDYVEIEELLKNTPDVTLIKREDTGSSSTDLSEGTLERSTDIAVYRISDSNIDSRILNSKCFVDPDK